MANGNHEAERRTHGAGLQGGERGGHGETGAIVAVTTHGGAGADTATIEETEVRRKLAWRWRNC